jgi:hypothetical protein
LSLDSRPHLVNSPPENGPDCRSFNTVTLQTLPIEVNFQPTLHGQPGTANIQFPKRPPAYSPLSACLKEIRSVARTATNPVNNPTATIAINIQAKVLQGTLAEPAQA